MDGLVRDRACTRHACPLGICEGFGLAQEDIQSHKDKHEYRYIHTLYEQARHDACTVLAIYRYAPARTHTHIHTHNRPTSIAASPCLHCKVTLGKE